PDQPPEGVAGEADRDQGQEHLPERLPGDLLERALLVRRLSARVERELDRQDADDPVDQPSRDEAGAGEPLEAAAARQLLSSNLNIPDCRFARRVHAHGRPPLAWAPLWERAPADRGYGPAAGRLRLRVRERGGGRGPRCGRRSVRRAPTVR